MDKALQFPGVSNAWTMPIKARIDMLSTGIRTPVGVKVFGADLGEIERLARQIEQVLKTVPGTSSAYAERIIGGYYLDITPDRDALARYGLMVGDVQDVVATALGGDAVTTTVEGRERYTVNVRYPRDLRSNPQAIANDVLVPMPKGGTVPLAEVAKVKLARGPTTIRTENGQLAAYIFVDIRDRDLGGYVAEAQKAVAASVVFPSGYYVTWSGQFEYLERAEARLKVVVPVTLLIIFLLLYLNFRTLTETLIVMLSLPFSLVGGLWLLWCARLQPLGCGRRGVHRAGGRRGRDRRRDAHLSRPCPHRGKGRMRGAASALHPRRPECRHHARRGRTRAAQDDDRRCHHGGFVADHVEHRHGFRGHAAHRRADDRGNGVLDIAHPDRHSRDLCGRQREGDRAQSVRAHSAGRDPAARASDPGGL